MKASGKSPLPVTVLSGFLERQDDLDDAKACAEICFHGALESPRQSHRHALNNREGLR